MTAEGPTEVVVEAESGLRHVWKAGRCQGGGGWVLEASQRPVLAWAVHDVWPGVGPRRTEEGMAAVAVGRVEALTRPIPDAPSLLSLKSPEAFLPPKTLEADLCARRRCSRGRSLLRARPLRVRA
jgi:hypothetical protein